VGFREATGEGDGFPKPDDGAIGLAEEPETPACKALHGHARIHRLDERLDVTCVRIVERQRFLAMLEGETEIAEMRARNSHRPVATHRSARIRNALGEPEQFRGDSQCGGDLSPEQVEGPSSPEHL
jgi:hypothetical protein